MTIGYGEHDAAQHALTIAGIPITGFAKESGIAIEPNSPHRAIYVGMDGLVVSSKLADRSATATIKLMAKSKAHRQLLALYVLDANTPGGAGVGGFELNDIVNGMVESSERCWIQTRPTLEVGPEEGEVEWKFLLGHWDTSFPA